MELAASPEKRAAIKADAENHRSRPLERFTLFPPPHGLREVASAARKVGEREWLGELTSPPPGSLLRTIG
jgi:hypothetical protein